MKKRVEVNSPGRQKSPCFNFPTLRRKVKGREEGRVATATIATPSALRATHTPTPPIVDSAEFGGEGEMASIGEQEGEGSKSEEGGASKAFPFALPHMKSF